MNGVTPAAATHGRPDRSMRFRIALAVVTVVTAVAALITAPTVALAGDGFTLDGTTAYRFDPAVPAVVVTSTYTMTNTRPDRTVGNRVEFFYFNGITVPITTSATDVAVLVDGDPADFEQPVVDGVTVLDVDFGFRLRYRRTATIEVTYRLLGDPPRSEESFVRVNPAYVSFPVFTYADDGRADVSVEIPDGWTPDFAGSDFDESTKTGGTIVFASDDIADAFDFGVLFTARQDSLLDSTPLAVGGDRFEIRSWPGDADWLAFAQRHVTDGLPALERLVGTPWPEASETDVVEASTPYLRGYAGYYFADTDVIEVGEDLDSHTVLHELSHAWFNQSAIEDRWISEGLADAVGARAVLALGGELPVPADYDGDAPIDVVPFPLNEWDRPDSALEDSSEYYGYRTSFEVMQALYDELGEARMADVLQALIARDRAYQGGTEPITSDSVMGWQAFLDLAEQVGGSERIEALYRDHVVTDAQALLLDRRTAAVEEYRGLVERGAGWDAPEAVRTLMADWRFGDATDLIASALAALDTRDELTTELETLGLRPAASLRAAFEDADSVEAVALDIDQQLAAAVRLAEERSELETQLASVGLDVPALTQVDYDAQPVAIAAGTARLSDQAADLVDADADLTETLATYELSVPPLAPSAFADSPEDALATIESLQGAADAVVAAERRRDDAGSILERLGGIGSDVDGELDVAAARLAAGDTEGATAAARDATSTISSWTSRGTARLVAVGLGIAGGVLLLTLSHVVRRRRTAPAAEPNAGT